jgi:transposase-like protein
MVSTMKEVDTLGMEHAQSRGGLVLRERRDGRRVYDPGHKRAIVAQCLRPGVSVAAIALSHGINANLVRKWIVKHQRATVATRSGAMSAALLPVTVESKSARSTVSPSAASASIVIELHGARIELVGAVDAEALRTVLRVVAAVRQ